MKLYYFVGIHYSSMETETLLYFLIGTGITVVCVMFAKQLQNVGDRLIKQWEIILGVVLIVVAITLQFAQPISRLIKNYNHHPFNTEQIYRVAFDYFAIAFALIIDIGAYLYILIRRNKKTLVSYAQIMNIKDEIDALKQEPDSIDKVVKYEKLGRKLEEFALKNHIKDK